MGHLPADDAEEGLVQCLVTALLMVFNGAIVAVGYRWLRDLGPAILSNPRVAQGSLFVMPVLLLFIQWWFLDRCLDWLRGSRPRT